MLAKHAKSWTKNFFLKQKFESPKFVSYASQWCAIGSEVFLGSRSFNFIHTWHLNTFQKIFSKSQNPPQKSIFGASCSLKLFSCSKRHFLRLKLRIFESWVLKLSSTPHSWSFLGSISKFSRAKFLISSLLFKKIDFFDFASTKSFKNA